MHLGALALRLFSAVFSGMLAGSLIGSGVARTQIGLKSQLNLTLIGLIAFSVLKTSVSHMNTDYIQLMQS